MSQDAVILASSVEFAEVPYPFSFRISQS